MSDVKSIDPAHGEPNQPPAPEVAHVDKVTFAKLEDRHLSAVPVMSQALDNQWLPRALLKQAARDGQVTGDMDEERGRLVRSEYIRSLINGQQVVINRAFIVNNPIISRDYSTTEGASSDALAVARRIENRDALKRLLEDGVVVPYLMYETSPTQKPNFSTTQFDDWCQLCREVKRLHCVRLSWDDEQNEKLMKVYLSGRFSDYAGTIAGGSKDFAEYTARLGLPADATDELRRHLLRIHSSTTSLLSEKGEVTREDLYKEFVTEGRRPADRQYGTAGFALEIKQLLDLAYNRNLPDALSGYLLTPADSLPRTALQEDRDLIGSARLRQLDPDELLRFLQRTAFSNVMEGLFLPSLDVLGMADIVRVREYDQWNAYSSSLRDLLHDPLTFAEGGANAVLTHYAALARQMTDLLRERRGEEMRRVERRTTFVVETVIEIGGAVLTVVGGVAGPLGHVAGVVGTIMARQAVPVAVRFVIRDVTGFRTRRDLSNSFELMRAKVTDGTDAWRQLLDYARAQGVRLEDPAPTADAANLTPPVLPEAVPPG